MPETHLLQLSDLRPGVQFRQYRLLEQIGAGGQGLVWSAHDQGKDRIVAIKFNEIPNSDQKKAEDQIFERQVSHLVTLRHPNILPMFDYGLIDQIRYMVSLYIPGESLEERLNGQALGAAETLRYATEIAAALDYLHAQQVVHRDLKPANILMDFSDNLYVADFGLARILSFSTQAMHTGRGTPPYASPEQHTMTEITLQSDLYSFGVMLYEMFTRQLPWKGEKILGIQQLNSNAEIPDPALVDPSLPADLVIALRRLTAANPAARPSSAGDAMRSIYASFQMTPIRSSAQDVEDETSRQARNADWIMRNSLARWKPADGTVVLSLTKFAYAELREKQAATQNASADVRQFVLQNALAFGYDDDFWWTKLTDPKERLAVTGRLIAAQDNPVISARAVRHLVNDAEIRRLNFRLPEGITRQLLELAARSADPSLRQQVLQFLSAFVPQASAWRAKAFTGEQDQLLARLALADDDLGDEAARLIGRLRSTEALEIILRTASPERGADVLLNIQKAAGGLPRSIPILVRLRTFAAWVTDRLGSELPGLPLAGLLILAGAVVSAGLQVYLTYRLPNFMDLERITVSVERGIFQGVGLGVGVLLAKSIVESFPEAKAPVRLAIASLASAAILSVSFFVYDTLFLQTIPQGPLLVVASLLLACGFAVAGLIRRRLGKIVISYLVVFAALAASWFIHTSLAATSALLSPLLFYDYTWSSAQVLQTIAMVALPVSVLAHLVSLAPQKN